ncbi:DUF4845 domain-containing protein [Undibacterium parvum]|uniref:DUF4845 domain-containing protein n=1 Tax=Undibacterium parvum TaxID=401471 RepID=A0A3Q9BN36_9BURK|nr:DUF4845 domain-containing protein [Undibacterium parvum]AZP10754.1 DUF4845 domain-containing protein [Undibacterium parvum]
MKNLGNYSLKQQQGISLVGLILTLGVLVFAAMLATKVAPTVIEYSSIKKAIVSSKQAGKTVRDIQTAFDKQAEVGYFDAVKGKDLTIVKNGEDMEVSFAYSKKIPLFGPASLLMEYEGTTAKSGTAAKMKE